LITAQTGAEKKKKRTESFPAAVNQMMRYFRNQLDFGIHIIIDAFLDPLKVVFICGKNILNKHLQPYLFIFL
jgi:hypothetical protein